MLPSIFKVLNYEDPFSVDKETIIERIDRDRLRINGLSLITSSYLDIVRQEPLVNTNNHYIPREIYELGLVDEFKDLCGLSYNTFNFVYNDLKEIFCEKGYKDEVATQRAHDHASYCLLGALKTEVVVKYPKVITTPQVSELEDFATHLGIDKVITSNIPIYGNKDSIISLYKHNIVNLLKSYDKFDEGLDEFDGKKAENKNEQNHVSINANLIKSLLCDLGLAKDGGSQPQGNIKLSQTYVKEESFKPSVTIAHFMDEKFCIDTLVSAILYECDEKILDIDEININNIDNNLRILDIDRMKVKQGILYDLLNGNKKLDEFTKELSLNKISENQISFNDLVAYNEEQNKVADPIVYQDYNNNNQTTINKEQNFIISKYIGDRKSRRDKLGKPFELISYTFELSTSYRIFRDLKRYALLAPRLLATRNSYDNYIFPSMFISNQHLFEEYRHLIDKSFEMYNKIIKKGGPYWASQYSNILGTRINYLVSRNFRQLDSMLSLNTQPSKHMETREVCQGIYNILKLVHPNVAKIMKFVDLNDYKK